MARWDKPGIPHKGWIQVDCIDLGVGLFGDEAIKYEICEMCHNERIRYVHILTHPNYLGEIRVGCVCACKMTGDYDSPREDEQRLRNRANRRINFFKQNWVRNQKGNLILRYKGEIITAIERNECYGFVFHNNWFWNYCDRPIRDFYTLKLAAFEVFDQDK